MEIKQLSNDRSVSYSYSVAITQSELSAKIEDKLLEISGDPSYRIPGYRPGKVPVSVVRAREKGRVRPTVLEELSKEALEKIVEELGGELIAQPRASYKNIEDTNLTDNIEITFDLDMMPVIPKIDWENFAIKTYNVTVEEQDIDEEIEKIKENLKEYRDIEENRLTENGDMIVMDSVGKINGEEFKEGNMKDFRVKIGSGSLIDGFEEQLIGKELNQAFDIKVTFPGDYHVENLRSKEADFNINIKKILVADDVDLSQSETLAKLEVKSIEELREKIRQLFKGIADSSNRKNITSLIFEKLKKVEFDLPSYVLEQQVNNAATQEMNKDKENKEKDLDYYKEKVTQSVSEGFRLSVILSKIIESENIEIQQSDVESYINKELSQYPAGQAEKLLSYYSQSNNEQLMQKIKGEVLEKKAVDFIIDNYLNLKTEKVDAEQFRDIVVDKNNYLLSSNDTKSAEEDKKE